MLLLETTDAKISILFFHNRIGKKQKRWCHLQILKIGCILAHGNIKVAAEVSDMMSLNQDFHSNPSKFSVSLYSVC